MTGLTPPLPVETERLLLRPHRLEDLDDLVRFHSDPEVVRHVPWPVRDRAATDEAVATFTSIGARAKDNLGTSEGAETNTGFSLHDGQPAYFCDSST